jgi:FkbM family methyltransferase
MKPLFKTAIKQVLYPPSRVRMQFCWLVLRYGHRKRFRAEAVTFFRYHFRVPDIESFIWQFKEIYVEQVYRFEATQTEPLILDCGANVGLSVLFLKELYPNARIKAFEADLEIGEMLEQNIARNNIHEVDVVKKAVWKDHGGVQFWSQGADGGSLLFGNDKRRVDSIRLRDELACQEVIDLLKMDIEGAETDVLVDCRDYLSRVQNLFVEYHSFVKGDQRLHEVLEILSRSGLRYYIEGVRQRKSPFIRKEKHLHLDLQLNIFAYRNR